MKMTTIIMEKSKKSYNNNEDCFFDLNKLAEEQTGKSQTKRLDVKDIALSTISSLKS